MKCKPLSPGDVIDIIAPGYACTAEEVEKVRHYVQSLGYVPRIPEDIVCTAEPYHSQTDGIRFAHLKNALLAKDSKAIWCMRGGYGAARLLQGLRDITPPGQAKWVIGFSDVTALHLFLTRYWQWPVLHAPVLYQLSMGKIAEESVQQVLGVISGQKTEITYNVEPLNTAAKEKYTINAPITGGNLSLVQTSIGTFWEVEAEGCMLFLEEYDEKAYAIDRMLYHLHQACILNKAKAVLIGDCEGAKLTDGSKHIAYAVQRFADSLPIPVLRIKGIGHGYVNNPLPMGVACALVTGSKATLHCDFRPFYG